MNALLKASPFSTCSMHMALYYARAEVEMVEELSLSLYDRATHISLRCPRSEVCERLEKLTQCHAWTVQLKWVTRMLTAWDRA